MRLEFPVASTLTITMLLLFDLDGLAVPERVRTFYYNRRVGLYARNYIDIRTTNRTQGNTPTFEPVVFDHKDIFRLVIAAHRCLRDRSDSWCLFLTSAVPLKKGYFYTHVRQNAWIVCWIEKVHIVRLGERNPNLNRRLLPIRSRNDCTNLGWNNPVRIGVEDSVHGLVGTDFRDVGLADIDFDFIGVRSTRVAMPVRVKPPPAETGETISPICASLETAIPAKGALILQ